MSVDPNFVEITADVLKMFLYNMVVLLLSSIMLLLRYVFNVLLLTLLASHKNPLPGDEVRLLPVVANIITAVAVDVQSDAEVFSGVLVRLTTCQQVNQ